MTDYIRKAVELADGWEMSGPKTIKYRGDWEDQEILDALAAQLVRQVDVLDLIFIDVVQGNATINQFDEYVEIENQWEVASSDRTMNTIKAIVDSGVLND